MPARFTREQYSPALFDVAQDIVGKLPVKLVERWLMSGQGHGDAVGLLERFKVTGYSVSSDSAGLSRLMKTRSLLEILALINRPKEIVHGFGTAIGGAGVGIWAADNTQMFYPSAVDASTLVSALLTMQDRIKATCPVQIGLGAHHGDFYSVGGGLYGEDADAIEEIAENETEGGEVVVSQSIYERLPRGHGFEVVKRTVKPSAVGDVYRVLDGPRLPGVEPTNTTYPIPYSDSFYKELVEYESRVDDAVFARGLAEKYTKRKVIVLVERESLDGETHEVDLFNNLALSAMMKDVGLKLLPEGDALEVKVSGPLGIYAFDDPSAAVAFAQAFRAELARNDIRCRIGVDAGPVLVFDLAVGGSDIAGNPVNIASKMAQDVGKSGKLYLSGAMKDHVDVSRFAEVSFVVSGVELTAYEG